MSVFANSKKDKDGKACELCMVWVGKHMSAAWKFSLVDDSSIPGHGTHTDRAKAVKDVTDAGFFDIEAETDDKAVADRLGVQLDEVAGIRKETLHFKERNEKAEANANEASCAVM